MDSVTCDRIIETQLEHSRKVLLAKQSEYAIGDRLHNFKVAAALQNCQPKEALAGFLAKHIVSVFDMCRSDETYSDAM